MIEPGIRCILFDAVGTLIYPDPAVADVYHRAASRYGSRLSREQIAVRFRAVFANDQQGPQGELSAIRPPQPAQLRRADTGVAEERARWRRIVREVISDVEDGAEPLFEELWQHFAQASHWQLFEEARPVWLALQQRGYQIGVASNFDERLAAIAGQLDPLHRTPHLYYSAGVGFSKPDPRFFRAIQEQLGLEPQQILLVGDDPISDHLGASHAGWQSLLVDRRGRLPASSGAISSLRDLL